MYILTERITMKIQNIQSVSFGTNFNTKDIVKMVGGAVADKEVLSKMSGISESNLTCNCSSDIYMASSRFAANKIVEQYPDLSPIQKISKIIHEKVNSSPINEEDFQEINKLSMKKAFLMSTFCLKHGDLIDIQPFEIPFIK